MYEHSVQKFHLICICCSMVGHPPFDYTVSSSKSKPIDPIWSDSRNFVKAIVFVSIDNECEKEISNEGSRQTICHYISQPIKQSLVFVRENCARHTQIVSTTIVRFHCSFFFSSMFALRERALRVINFPCLFKWQKWIFHSAIYLQRKQMPKNNLSKYSDVSSHSLQLQTSGQRICVQFFWAIEFWISFIGPI